MVLARLSALGEGVERLEAAGARIEVDESGAELEYQQLSLRAPRDGHLLVANLSTRLAVGSRTLVSGDAEASIALFRAAAGLWDSGEGRIVRPPPDEILLLAERPYLPPGTLRQALTRSAREQDVADARIHEVLGELGVGGEQQLLSLARLALAAPATQSWIGRRRFSTPRPSRARSTSSLASGSAS